MKRIIGILGLLGLIGCGDDAPTAQVMGTAAMDDAAFYQMVETRKSALFAGGAAYFKLLDDSGVTDGVDGYRMLGPAASFGDQNVWVYAIGTTPNALGLLRWIQVPAPAYGFTGGSCILPQPAYDAAAPYVDTSALLHLWAGTHKDIYDGSWRVWGNGNLAVNQGGGSTAGVMLRAGSSNFVLGVKLTAERVVANGNNLRGCSEVGGPGVIGAVAFVKIPNF